MRAISESLKEKFSAQIQTRSQGNDLSAYVRVIRNQTRLTGGRYLERVKIADAVSENAVSDTAIAVRHSSAGGMDGDIWAAMSDGGELRVFRSAQSGSLETIKFIELSANADAVSCAIAFDAVTHRNPDGTEEFITDSTPFLFLVQPDGSLRARRWGANEDTVLASSDVLRVSAVRASYSAVDRFDFGLCVFFLTESGQVFYRQYIKGVWYDAVPVQFGPAGVVFTDIAAFRTWDYRVGIQGITADGTIYEIYTQYEGIGTRNQEHIDISGITASGVLTSVGYHDGYENEHIEVSGITASGGLWRIGVPSIIDAYNEYIDLGTEDFYPGEEDTPILYD